MIGKFIVSLPSASDHSFDRYVVGLVMLVEIARSLSP